jgi:hypothetical protein
MNEVRQNRQIALNRLRGSIPETGRLVAERMALIRRRHCSTHRDHLIRKRVERMKESLAYSFGSDEDKKNKILFVTGESNAGKSRLVDHVFADDPGFAVYETSEHVTAMPVLRIRAPTPSSLRNIAVTILKALDYPIIGDIKETRAWPIVAEQIILRQVMFIVIEEAQRMMKMEDETELQKVSDALINLVDSDVWPVRLILVGVDPLSSLRTRDRQMHNRSRVMPLGPVVSGRASRVMEWIREIIVDHASLEIESGFDFDDCSERLIHACSGNAGSIIELIRDALENTLRNERTTVGMSDFAQAYHDLTSCLPHDNVFDVSSWQQVPEGAAKLPDKDAGEEAENAREPKAKMKFGERPR